MSRLVHDHDAILAHDINDEGGGPFMYAFLVHVRDDHGHDVDRKTPWERLVALHREDHA